MKVVLGATYRTLQLQINRMSERLQKLQVTVATGKKLSKASDDPAAIRPVLDARTRIKANDRYLKTMGVAQDKIQALDSYMDNIANIMVNAKELAISSGNGALDDRGRETLADQVAQLRSELLDTANAKVDDKYIFAGFEEDTKPFTVNSSYSAATYDPTDPSTFPVLFNVDSANARTTSLEISPGEKIQVNLTGNSVFLGDADGDGVPDAGGVDLFAALTKIEAAMRANDQAAVEGQFDALDAGADQSRMLRNKMGGYARRIENAMDHMQGIQIDLQQMRSRYEDADILKTINDMTQQQTALKAALDVTAKISDLSILDFM